MFDVITKYLEKSSYCPNCWADIRLESFPCDCNLSIAEKRMYFNYTTTDYQLILFLTSLSLEIHDCSGGYGELYKIFEINFDCIDSNNIYDVINCDYIEKILENICLS